MTTASSRPDAAGRRNPPRRRQGVDPIGPWRRPHPRRHLRRAADRAVGDPASGLRDDAETIVPEAMTRSDRADHGAYAAAAKRAQSGRLRLRRDPRGARLSDPQFHAPFENRRTDEYGGRLEPRALRARRVRAVKRRGAGLGVIYRLSVEDYFDGGLPYDEGRGIAIWAAKAGADAIHVTAGHYRSKPTAHRMIPPMNEPDAPFSNTPPISRSR